VLRSFKKDSIYIQELHVEVKQLGSVVGNFLGKAPLDLHCGVKEDHKAGRVLGSHEALRKVNKSR
jgi:hypothetical protein